MTSYGPWKIDNAKSMKQLAQIIVAVTLLASRKAWRAVHLTANICLQPVTPITTCCLCSFLSSRCFSMWRRCISRPCSVGVLSTLFWRAAKRCCDFCISNRCAGCNSSFSKVSSRSKGTSICLCILAYRFNLIPIRIENNPINEFAALITQIPSCKTKQKLLCGFQHLQMLG